MGAPGRCLLGAQPVLRWSAWRPAEFRGDKITLRPNFLLNDPGPRDTSHDYVIFVGRLCAEKGVRQLL